MIIQIFVKYINDDIEFNKENCDIMIIFVDNIYY